MIQRLCTLLLATFLSFSAEALAQGGRIHTFPYAQDFAWVLGTTTLFPTSSGSGGEFTVDANTDAMWLAGANITDQGLNPNGGAGAAIRLQTTAASPVAGFIWYGDFNCYTADSLVIEWAKVQHGVPGVPINELRIATNGGSGSVFTDLPLANIVGGAWASFDNSATAQSGSLRVKLPASLAGAADARIRIYTMSISGVGEQPRVVVDDLSITGSPVAPPGVGIDSVVSMRTSNLTVYVNPGVVADSILVIRRAGAAPIATPVDGSRYTAGQGLNSTDTVVYFGPSANRAVAMNNLQTSTVYHVAAYGYRSCNGRYSTVGAAASAVTLSCGGAPATIAALTTLARAQDSLTFAYSVGTRTDSILVIRRLNGTPTAVPANGVRYFVGQGLNFGDTVVYFGPVSSSFVSRELVKDTSYSFTFYGFQSCNAAYSATRALVSARTYCTTVVGNVAELSVRYATATNIGLSISPASNADTYIVFRHGPDTARPRPVSGVPYSVGMVVGDDTVKFVGSNRQPILTGLTPSTAYRFTAFGFRDCNFAYSELGDTANAVTLATCAGAVPGMVDSIRVMKNVSDTLALRWRPVANATGYLIVARIDSTPTSSPLSNTFYGVNDTVGGKVVVLARTTDTTVTLIGRPQNTAYFIRVFAYRACDLAYSPASRVLPVATRGTANSQRFALTAGSMDTIRFAGAEVKFNEPIHVDGSLVITRQSGPMGLEGIPMFRTGRLPINVLSYDRWWSFGWAHIGEDVNFDLKFDITGLPGVQDTNDLEVVFRTAPTFPWEDFITTGYQMDSTARYLLAENRRFFSSDYAIGANSTLNTLPVNLLSFEGFSREGRNLLRWRTAEEKDNAGFRLYRATSGVDEKFSLVADYLSDGRLRGAGNTSQARSYDYTDQSDDLRMGAMYIYKLEEVSLDGSSNEIGRLVLTMDAVSRLGSAFRIVPNPIAASGAATVSYRLNDNAPVSITLVNAIGETVRVLVNEPDAQAGSHSITMNVADLPAGTYFCRVIAGGVSSAYPVTVIR